MNKRLLATALLSLSLAANLLAVDSSLRDLRETTVRGGLPNVLAKLDAGKEVRIGYLGGSITAQPGWRVKSLKWFQEQYPKATVSEINAAIGGTGSDLGVFRVGQDVLDHKPDLLFVEFAVNDGGAAPDRIIKGMEGIVRQTWKADASTDICFVYTLSEPVLADVQAGKFQRSATAMEEVADHYGIPSIHFGLEVAKRVADGTLIFKGEKPTGTPQPGAPMVFSPDGVHPFPETGHELYLAAIVRSMAKIQGVGKTGAHKLPTPLDAGNWEQAKLVPITQAMLSGKWTQLDPKTHNLAGRFQDKLPVLWNTDEPGASMTFKFKGTQAAMYDLLGPDCGQLTLRVDDQPEKTIRRIDGYCTYHRLSKFNVTESSSPEVHTVTLTLQPESPDKANILFERNRPDLEKNPAKYAGINWYVGRIMLIGDLVK